jgi:hypothetical protein
MDSFSLPTLRWRPVAQWPLSESPEASKRHGLEVTTLRAGLMQPPYLEFSHINCDL